MVISVHRARPDEAGLITSLFRGLAAEMDALRPLWSDAEGLAEPVEGSVGKLLTDSDWHGYVASIDDAPVGFLLARDEELLPQADGRLVGAIRFIYTIPEAREVGAGEAMFEAYLADAIERGLTMFDAHVSPGHRESKNFFESNGFSARSIVMHRGSAT